MIPSRISCDCRSKPSIIDSMANKMISYSFGRAAIATIGRPCGMKMSSVTQLTDELRA